MLLVVQARTTILVPSHNKVSNGRIRDFRTSIKASPCYLHRQCSSTISPTRLMITSLTRAGPHTQLRESNGPANYGMWEVCGQLDRVSSMTERRDKCRVEVQQGHQSKQGDIGHVAIWIRAWQPNPTGSKATHRDGHARWRRKDPFCAVKFAAKQTRILLFLNIFFADFPRS